MLIKSPLRVNANETIALFTYCVRIKAVVQSAYNCAGGLKSA
jgi:hypothetical protein